MIILNRTFYNILGNVYFPDNLEESFYQGLIKEHSMLQDDQAVPADTAFTSEECIECEFNMRC